MRALDAQSAGVFVFRREANDSFFRSRIDAPTREQVADVRGGVLGLEIAGRDAEAAEVLLRQVDAARANVLAHVDGKQVVKTIVVPGRLVNLVVR